MVMHLLLGTNNAGKVIEISEALHGLPILLYTPQHLSITDIPPETGDTFEENALQKARFYFEQAGIPTVADDSGIIVEVLQDELGLHTRRWGAGPSASDEEWIAHFLKRMKKEKNKRARFVCVLAHIDAEGKPHVFEGTCEGTVTANMEADFLPGLPISACFRPDGYELVFSALTPEQKNRTSHRGRASAKLRKHLDKLLRN